MKMIEVTDSYSGERILINTENIMKVEEYSEEEGCSICLDMLEESIECKESYDEVYQKIKAAENE